MIHPSYTELIQAINNNAEDDDNTMMLNSRYSLVLATSKRARQLIAGAEPLVPGAGGKKPLSIAIEELYKGEVKIVAAGESDETVVPSVSSAISEAALEEAEAAQEKGDSDEDDDMDDEDDAEDEEEDGEPEDSGDEA